MKSPTASRWTSPKSNSRTPRRSNKGKAGSKRTGPATRTSTTIGKSDTIGLSSRRSCASNPPTRVLPVRVAQPALENFAAFLARQRVGELDQARHLVIGDPRLEERAHRIALQRLIAMRLDVRCERLAELGIRHAEHRAIGNA